MKTEQVLARVRLAGNRIASPTVFETFSCNALKRAGLSRDFADAYWLQLFEARGTHVTLDDRLVEEGDLPHAFWALPDGQAEAGARRCREVRLMMLAWLHEMVRTGEFERIAPPEKNA